MQSSWRDEGDIEAWRDSIGRFLDERLVPRAAEWDARGLIDRDAWQLAGSLGLLGADLPEAYGGTGGTFAHAAIVSEELARRGLNSFRVAITIHVIAMHYILSYGSEEQKRTWLPLLASGEKIAGLGMSEPGGGSDLQNLRTRANRIGDVYAISGSKIFITNGSSADLLVVACKTDAALRARGISMILLETGTPGFSVGKRLEKVGLHASDTCELFFDECKVPLANLLGEAEGGGFYQMMEQLPYERVAAAVANAATMEYAFELTKRYCTEREAFGQPITAFQNTRFELAAIKTTACVARSFVDSVIGAMISGAADTTLASMAKYWTSEQMNILVDKCVQLFGGYGYVTEYPIARLYADARVERIYGGTTEIMKELIGRDL